MAYTMDKSDASAGIAGEGPRGQAMGLRTSDGRQTGNWRLVVRTPLLSTAGVIVGVLVFSSTPALAAPPEAPVTEAATLVTASTATLNGELNPAASATAGYQFTFNTNGTCTEGPVTEPGAEVTGEAIQISTPLTGLEPSREYTFCVVATHLEGETTEATSGEPVSFKTLAAPPAVDAESVSAVTAFSANLEAQVNPENQETTTSFQYSTQATGETLEGEITTVPAGTLGPEFGDRPASAPTGVVLKPGTTYFFRVIAENTAAEKTEGRVERFTTPGTPVIGTGSVHGITRTSATIAAEIDADAAASEYFLEYGQGEPRGAPGSPTRVQTLPAEPAGPQPVAPITLEELTPDTTYHYRIVAVNEAGSTPGPEGSFTTDPPQPPTASTGEPFEVTQTSATITATVNPDGLPTTYTFEVGTDTSYGTQSFGEAGSGASAVSVSLPLTGLLPATTYHYRIVASNQDGTSQGADHTFTTPGSPSPIAVPPQSFALLPFTLPSEPPPLVGHSQPLTRTQKLARALRACKRKPKNKRAACVRQAHRLYGPTAKRRK